MEANNLYHIQFNFELDYLKYFQQGKFHRQIFELMIVFHWFCRELEFPSKI